MSTPFHWSKALLPGLFITLIKTPLGAEACVQSDILASSTQETSQGWDWKHTS